MAKKIMIVAPHPDDETLGCGGTILKHKMQGDSVSWLIVTEMRTEHGNSPACLEKRDREIREVAALYEFDAVEFMAVPTTTLDHQKMGELVARFGQVVDKMKPTDIYLPFGGDIHTDHRITFDMAMAGTKWFRYPYVKRILCYETPSETDMAVSVNGKCFCPNSFMDISAHFDKKLRIMHTYESEMGDFPFPRSDEAITALAKVRGSQCGCQYAEAFMLLKEIR